MVIGSFGRVCAKAFHRMLVIKLLFSLAVVSCDQG
jgi:hypothetical protein